MGGTYDAASGAYDATALSFFKEWNTVKFWKSYGNAGSAEVWTDVVLVQIADGCKRSFVEAGGNDWETSHDDQTPAWDPSSTETASHSFRFGSSWTTQSGHGNLCAHDVKGWGEDAQDDAFEVSPWLDPSDREDGLQDPTQLRGRLNDRYHENHIETTGLYIKKITAPEEPMIWDFGETIWVWQNYDLRVRNGADADRSSPGSVAVRLVNSGYEQYVPSLEPGEETTLTFATVLLTDADGVPKNDEQGFTWLVDPNERSPEANRANNDATVLF